MNLGQIKERIRMLKLDGKECISNFYYRAEDNEKEYQVWSGEHSLIFSYEKLGINQVYFISNDEEELRRGLSLLPKNSVIHLISKDKEVGEEWSKRLGYPLYSIYGRFGYSLGTLEIETKRFAENKLDRFYDDRFGVFATNADLNDIQKIIFETFDVNCDVLFTDAEMEKLIQNKNVWIEKENGEICTLFIYRIEGKKYYANLAVNRSTADILYSIQKKSILQEIQEHNVTYFYGWQSLTNMQATRKHGFPEFDLYNLIFKR